MVPSSAVKKAILQMNP